MGRKDDLERHIRDSYRLICEYEEILRLSTDPKEQARSRRVIEEQQDFTKGYLEEYTPLCKHRGLALPEDIIEIAVSVGIMLPSTSSIQLVPAPSIIPKSKSGDQSTALVTVLLEGDAQEFTPLIQEISRPRKISRRKAVAIDAHALLIGVGDYTHPRFTDLPATIRDAQAVTAVLTNPACCGYPPANVQLLTSEQANAANVRAALNSLTQSTTPQSTVFFYFSGHGGRALENSQWRIYLCPREADPNDLLNTAISGAEFSAALSAIPARRVLAVLDACHAGGSAELKAADGTTMWKSGLPEDYYEALSQGSGRVVIASSKAEQYSRVRPQGDLSVFTYHLRDALDGKAAVRGDGLIHVLDVFHYVNEAVQADQPNQTPILKVKDLDLNYPIAIAPTKVSKAPKASKVTREVEDIREQIVRDPIAGAKALSEYLENHPDLATKRNEVDLKRSQLEDIQHDLELFGPDPGKKAEKNRTVFYLLRICLELELSE